jgi:putative mRNA 3-end processing factor
MTSVKVLGGGMEVGRAAIEVFDRNEAVILDYGVNFDQNDNPVLPLQETPSLVKGFVASHAHLDHVGALPLYQVSTDIPVYGTEVTREIAELMLKDFLKLSGSKVPFEWVEVKKVIDNWKPKRLYETFEIGNFKVELSNAGHIPGSSIIKVHTSTHTVAYTGDINLMNTALTKPADLNSLRDVNVLVMETTYGRFNHPAREQTERAFVEAVREVVESGGTVLVPAFSLARSQELLAVLAKYGFEYPVFYDGMVREIMDLMIKHKESINDWNSLKKAYDEFTYVSTWEERSKAVKEKGVIISSAGMLKGGPAVWYFRKISSNPKNAVFLVSYQAENTPGRRILETGKFDEYSPLLKARLELFDFSSHAGKKELKKIVKSAEKLEKLILVHGSPDNLTAFGKEIKEETGVDVIIPQSGQEIKL